MNLAAIGRRPTFPPSVAQRAGVICVRELVGWHLVPEYCRPYAVGYHVARELVGLRLVPDVACHVAESVEIMSIPLGVRERRRHGDFIGALVRLDEGSASGSERSGWRCSY